MSYSYLDQECISDSPENDSSALLVKPITVLVVDDHILIRAIISQILTAHSEVKQVVTVKNYGEAEEQAVKLHPDVICLDMHIMYGDSIAQIRRLRKLSPDSLIMALADIEDEQEAFAAIMAGAQGYRSKQDMDLGDIMNMIHMLCRGEYALLPALLTRLVQRLRNTAMPLWGNESKVGHRALLLDRDSNGLAQLTMRERQILQLISQGYRDRDIAEGLHIAEKTVHKHVSSILGKLGAQNRTEATYFILRQPAGV
jgi:two-component system response regulator DevR